MTFKSRFMSGKSRFMSSLGKGRPLGNPKIPGDTGENSFEVMRKRQQMAALVEARHTKRLSIYSRWFSWVEVKRASESDATRSFTQSARDAVAAMNSLGIAAVGMDESGRIIECLDKGLGDSAIPTVDQRGAPLIKE